MVNKILATFVVADVLFLITGAVTLGFSLIARNNMFEQPDEGQQAARNLIYQKFPFEAGIANAAFIFITFVMTLPGIITPTRGWLKLAAYLITFCALFSLCVGVYLWVLTLTTQFDFFAIWIAQEPGVQNLMQTSFNCCGYFNSSSPAFVTNDLCSSPAAAALQRGCSGPVTSYSNILIDGIFTAVFGMVGVDALLIICLAVLLEDRKERERFRHIDEKSGYRSL
ncbi:hypothetical protein HYQ45_003952 [Verticillium longisporum]|uniref:Tetraspanin n=3 Tax=Verticillium TaxID=1036719 RepID=G2WVY3_VERDV|nr:tetraspanin [Verticillium dahliae VdLs.17]KAF3350262.1 Kinesin-like motor protein C15D4.01c [Verticillium dahliae VDG2]KAF3354760.1 hypothetical protein VdG1_07246 [Verticillium dahliae VDG1]KAG7138906.1 hypothetical protein HYQ45_003952 [Verticillium longisporum]KAH6706054.1 tetraspanin [Verticillium dahliae]EGY19753.1 tetraspanin [Verticillium dahliae VdLs.17]